ncbi:MAG TPA: M20 family metallopeptidase [Thermomicrobiales bacterium]|nr:M20 family metallopeptidase [Thermomicrobiales bacterium]
MPTETANRILERIHEDESVSLLQALVRDAASVNPPGDVRESIRICQEKLGSEGFETEIIGDIEIMPNLVATLRRGSGPTLLFNAHVDVVPTGALEAWSYPPFEGVVDNGRVYGRGAGDDKASVTAQVMGAIAVARSGVPLNGTLIVNVVADEETGGVHGAKHVVDHIASRPDFVIVGEQTMNRVCVGERGFASTEVTVHGRAAHGALPWEGANAIEAMAEVIVALRAQLWPKLEERTHPYFHHSSASINLIEGGVKANVVPDRCSIYIDRRIIPGERPEDDVQEIRDVTERAVAGMAGVSVEVIGRGLGAASMSDPDSAVVRAMLAANESLGLDTNLTGFSMGTDGRHFAAVGIPTIIYGPGDPKLAHIPDEWVGVDEMLDAARAYALAALEILGV